MSAAFVRTNSLKETRLTIVDDDEKVHVTHLYNFDMSLLSPIRSSKNAPLELSKRQEKEFVRALGSPEGKKILRELKDSKTDEIINQFIDIQRKEIGIYDNKPGESKLSNFLKEMMRTPLQGTGYIDFVTIGLSKRQIYEALKEHKLIHL